MSESLRDELLRLIEEGVPSQAEAARRLGVSSQTVNRMVLTEGLDLRFVRPPRPVMVCKTCSREYRPTPRSRDGVCVPCQWAAKRALRPGKVRRVPVVDDRPPFAADSGLSTTDRLLLLLQHEPVSSQAEAARRLGVARQLISRIALVEGLDLKHQVKRRSRICNVCSKRYYSRIEARDGMCGNCTRAAKRVTLVCPRCGLSRTLPPSLSRQRVSSICKPCQRGIPRHLSRLNPSDLPEPPPPRNTIR